MNQNAALSLAPKLASASLTLESLIAEGAGEFLIAQARKTVRVLAADLKAACEEPQSFQPWSPHNPRNAYKPGAAT